MSTQSLAYKHINNEYPSNSIDAIILEIEKLIDNALLEHSSALHNDDLCLNAIQYHLSSPGQKVRAKLCIHACLKLGVRYADMLILAAVAELLHNASLIHDDIQDADEIRRGQPSVWKKFGANIAICAGDFLLSMAYGILARFSQTRLLPKLLTTIHQQTSQAIQGQSKDIVYKNNSQITIEEYIQISTKKSGALLSLPIEMALIASDLNSHIEIARKASYHFAVGYQIADDLDDIVKDSSTLKVNKSVNIVFVLKNLGYANCQQQAIEICQIHLNNALSYANQLPNHSGLLISNLVDALKNKTQIA